MDELYPGMNSYDPRLTSFPELYLYSSIIVGFMALFTFALLKEPKRYYRILKRKNTDENPIISI